MNCQRCQRPFEPRKRWSLYCSSRCRLRAWRDSRKVGLHDHAFHERDGDRHNAVCVEDGAMVRLITAEQFGERLGLTAQTVRTKAKALGLPQPVRLGKCLRWRERDVYAFINGESAEQQAVGAAEGVGGG